MWINSVNAENLIKAISDAIDATKDSSVLKMATKESLKRAAFAFSEGTKNGITTEDINFLADMYHGMFALQKDIPCITAIESVIYNEFDFEN